MKEHTKEAINVGGHGLRKLPQIFLFNFGKKNHYKMFVQYNCFKVCVRVEQIPTYSHAECETFLL